MKQSMKVVVLPDISVLAAGEADRAVELLPGTPVNAIVQFGGEPVAIGEVRAAEVRDGQILAEVVMDLPRHVQPELQIRSLSAGAPGFVGVPVVDPSGRPIGAATAATVRVDQGR